MRDLAMLGLSCALSVAASSPIRRLALHIATGKCCLTSTFWSPIWRVTGGDRLLAGRAASDAAVGSSPWLMRTSSTSAEASAATALELAAGAAEDPIAVLEANNALLDPAEFLEAATQRGEHVRCGVRTLSLPPSPRLASLSRFALSPSPPLSLSRLLSLPRLLSPPGLPSLLSPLPLLCLPPQPPPSPR